MTLLEKRFAAVILVIGCIAAVIGAFGETPFGTLILLASVMYVVFMYVTSNGDNDDNS